MGGSRGPPGRPWGALGAGMAPRGSQNRGQEAPKSLLGQGWLWRCFPDMLFSSFGQGFGLDFEAFSARFYSLFGARVPLHFRHAFALPRCLTFMFLWAARKRAPMLKTLALPIDFHVFSCLAFWPPPPRRSKPKRKRHSKKSLKCRRISLIFLCFLGSDRLCSKSPPREPAKYPTCLQFLPFHLKMEPGV